MTNLLVELYHSFQDTTGRKPTPPKTAVGNDEEIVGILPEELQRLWALGERIQESGVQNLAKLLFRAADDMTKQRRIPDVDPHLLRENDLLRLRDEALKGVFWASVKLTFPETIGKSVGIRAGWQVVIMKPSADEVKLSLVAELSPRA